MKQLNIRVDGMSSYEISKLDESFVNLGWKLVVASRKVGSHSFRAYQWEHSESEPVYPEGYEPHKGESIDLNQRHYPAD